MVRTYPLHLSPKQAQRCADIRREAGACWTKTVELARDHYKKTRKWIAEGELKSLLKGQFTLHSQTVQALVEKYIANRETTATLRRQGHTDIKYPYKPKNYQTPTWKRSGIEISGSRIIVKMARGQKPLILPHPVPGIDPLLAELTWENGTYYLHLTVEQSKPEPIQGERIAAIDLGEIHAVTITDASESLVVSGRQIRSVKRYRNKRVSDIQKAMSRSKKGGRKWKKLMRAKHRVQARTEAQLQNLHHQVTAKVRAHCVQCGITKVVIGDPEGVQRDTRKGQPKRRRSRKVAQKLSQWEFGTTRQYLRYKLGSRNVEVFDESEAYTSQHCPACGHRHKPKRRIYHCYCGFTWHRDALGAWNILSRHLHGELVAGQKPGADHQIKYRHPYRWLWPVSRESVVAPTRASVA